MEYYKYSYRLDGILWFFIWSTNDVDGVLVDPSGVVRTFQSEGGMNSYASHVGIKIEVGDPASCDFDALNRWAENPMKDRLDSELALDAWNLFEDFARSLPGQAKEFEAVRKGKRGIYQRLFWGSSVPVRVFEKESIKPNWSTSDIAAMVKIFSCGIEMVRSSTKPFEII